MDRIASKLSWALWIVLLVILGVASMCSLRWVSPCAHMESNFGASRDLTYAVILGLLILLVGALAPMVRPSSWSLFLKVCLVLLVAGLAISSFHATDKAVAFFAAGGLLVGLALMFITYRLADRPWKIHLALIVVTALGASFAAKAWIREKIEINQTWQNYLETKAEFWAKQGKSPDDPSVRLFEERMLSRDNGGFFFHGNLGGMYLATVLFVSLALVARRFADRRLAYGRAWLIGSILVSLLILSALILTASKGAILATILTVLILAVLKLAANRLRNHFRLAVAGAVLLVAGVAAAMVGYGLTRNTLPTLSMAYRWQYWVASFHMFTDHALAGVGLENYAHYYQQYKLPQAEEEITSPHNYIVEGFTELGVIGGLGFALLPFAIFYQLARDSVRRGEEASLSVIANGGKQSGPLTSAVSAGQIASARKTKSGPRNDALGPAAKVSAPWMLLATLGGTFLLLFVFNPSGLPGPLYLLAEYLPYILIFAAVFVLAGLKENRFEVIEDAAPTSGMTLCLTGALVAFMLGEVVNFSLEEPSTQFLFFFLAGLTLAAVRPPGPRTPRVFGRPNVGYCVAGALYAVLMVYPAVAAENAACEAERLPATLDPAYDPPYAAFTELSSRFSYDAHLPAQAAKRLAKIAPSASQPAQIINQALGQLDTAIRRAPVIWEFYSQAAQCHLMLADLEPDRKLYHLAAAEAFFGKARTVAPRSKSLAVTLGLTYARHIANLPATATAERARLAAQARENLDDALQLDRALPVESHRHLRPAQVESLQAALKAVQP